ncbi:acyltransferase family protein [Cellvibrio sp. NN19]|uniref:acyltransferase family protein n=1 Tax=Cellvibrio chitinivorans TaxID=3102792 RepID=UPI002B404030|nr:acyltransferase family protein [Cellvibrio sp. NN19]
MDAARAFALILGIFFHASLSFMPMFIGWAVMDVSTSESVSLFVMIAHSFRMELFFLIAGFFSYMSFHNQGVKSFVRSRALRIAVPFVIGWFLLRPLLVLGWVMGAESMRGEVNILMELEASFASLGSLPNGLFTGTHLWFLYYLLMISAIFISLRFLLSAYKPFHKKLMQASDATMFWIGNSKLAIVALAIPTAICLWFMSHWSVDTPDKTLVPNVPVLLVYGGFFSFGWLLHRQAGLIESFSRLTWGKFILCMGGIILTSVIYDMGINLSDPHYYLFKACFVVSHAIMMWSLVALIIGVFKQFFDRPRKVVRYLADSSYWLYLVHLPIVIFLQIAFAELPLHWLTKLMSISLLTIVISIVIYDALIRSTFVGTILNGKRKQRLLFNRCESASLELS